MPASDPLNPGPIDRVRQEIERWVETARITGERALDAVGIAREERPLPPYADLLETEADLHLLVDLPGVSADGVELSLTGQSLTVRAQRPLSAFDTETAKYHLRERHALKYERTIVLPTPVDAESVRAVVRDGLLHVTMPKSRLSAARPIPIQRGPDGAPESAAEGGSAPA